jgi:hypothetical protein
MPKHPKHPPAITTELDMVALTEALERERLRCRLSHHDLAAELGVSYSAYSYWRSRHSGMTGSAAVRVSVFLREDLRSFAVRKPAADPAPAVSADAA